MNKRQGQGDRYEEQGTPDLNHSTSPLFSHNISLVVVFCSVSHFMARIFAPRIVFQHDRKPTNQNLWITPRDLVMSNQCTLITDPWYNYYSLLYEKNLLEQWSAGLTLPWQVGPHTKLSGFNGSSPARFSGLGGSLSSRFSGLTGSLHGRFSGLIPGIQSRFSAKHRGDRRRGEAHGKWVSD